MINIIYTVLCIACLCIGFFAGYKINKPKEEKKVVIKKMKPIEKVKKKREDKELEEFTREQMEKYQSILDNINNYDGSGKNQKEIK